MTGVSSADAATLGSARSTGSADSSGSTEKFGTTLTAPGSAARASSTSSVGFAETSTPPVIQNVLSTRTSPVSSSADSAASASRIDERAWACSALAARAGSPWSARRTPASSNVTTISTGASADVADAAAVPESCLAAAGSVPASAASRSSSATCAGAPDATGPAGAATAGATSPTRSRAGRSAYRRACERGRATVTRRSPFGSGGALTQTEERRKIMEA